MNWLSFETKTGAEPPKSVIQVYRHFVFVSLWIISVSGLLLSAVISMIIFKLITQTQQALYELFVNPGFAPDSIWNAIWYGLIAITFASPFLLICIGIRKRMGAIYHCLYFINSITRSINSVPDLFLKVYPGPMKEIFDPEFRGWFFDSE